jgi:aspartate/methionine/tyrosine aminotransferase
MEFPLLQKTPLYRAFSHVGKRIFQPNGIFYWANRAKTEGRVNATIGSAFGPETDLIPSGREKDLVYYLPGLAKNITIEPERMASYAPVPGVPSFRDLWEQWIVHKGKIAQNLPSGPRDVSGLISRPVVCNGITNAIFVATRLFLDPGDQIICPNKRWGNYNAVLKLQNGLELKTYQFFKGGGFNIAEFSKVIEEVLAVADKAVVILNFPNNPTGYCPTSDEAAKIVSSLVEISRSWNKPIIVLCDDAYEGFVYGKQAVTHSLFYELVDRSPLVIPIKMDGTSKEMLMYGGRIACITLGISAKWVDSNFLPSLKLEWDNKIQGMIRSTISNANHLAQELLTEYLKDGFVELEKEVAMVQKILQKRYEKTMEAYETNRHPKVTVDPASGGFFVFLNVEGVPATKFADHLVSKYGIGTFPNENPEEGVNGIRFAFCSVPADQIEDCFQKIYQTMADLEG